MRNCSETDSFVSKVALSCSAVPIVRPCNYHTNELHDFTFGQDLATYLKAFALIYVLPEEEWTAEYVDKLLHEGEELFKNCSEDDHADGPLQQANIGNCVNHSVRRKFSLEGHNFTLELKAPYQSDKRKPLAHIMRNLKPVLQGFFRSAHYCMLLTKSGYLLIWRRRKVFFVLDMKGRRREDLDSSKHGVAMLICLQSIDKVVHLITHLSPVSANDKFFIRELAIIRLVMPDGRVFMRESDTQPVEYNIISQNYAYLTSRLHLSLNPDEELRNRSSLVVGVAAIVASKIEPPAAWSTSMFDRLICYGVEICRNCLEDENMSIDLNNFPSQLRLGQFVIELKMKPKVCTGHWGKSDVFNKCESDIQQTLKTHCNALFEINSQTYALWVKENFYYLLDPYRHTVMKQQNELNEATICNKLATVRMFRDTNTLFSVFHQLLKESNCQSSYSVHVAQIKNIKKCPKGYSLKPLPDRSNYDVKSLNEKITFPPNINHNELLLKELSDFEPDLSSDHEQQKFKLQMCKEENKVIVETLKPTVKSMYTKLPKIDINVITESSYADLNSDCDQPGESSVLGDHAQQMSSIVSKPKLQVKKEISQSKADKIKGVTSTSKHMFIKVPNSAPTRCVSPAMKPVVGGVIIKPDVKPPPVEPKNSAPTRCVSPAMKPVVGGVIIKPDVKPPPVEPKKAKPSVHSQVPITTAIKPLVPQSIFAGTKTARMLTKKSQNLYDKYRHKNPENVPRTTPVPVVASSTVARKKGVWNARATDNLNAMRLIPKPEPRHKPQADKKPTKTQHSQTSFKSAQLPPEISDSLMERILTPNSEVKYPVYSKYPHVLAVAGSESGTMESLKRLLDYAFKVSNRVLTMTPWGNYVVFRYSHLFYVFDGCTCNIDRFRHLDLSHGTAGLLPFKTKSQVICYMIDSRELRASKMLHSTLDDSNHRFEELLGRGA
ncbi:hypothetical protein KR093_003855 [Drosophila rubida]|uniref:Uncharacterized protein n=1 Tax=Drosophila rubida TaxID=30044 RepID=A0AAD4JZ12_9MUSC|nr:hypothetical protein KR093_003855 [Drosophila rubida]